MANWNTGHNHFPADVGVQCGLIAATNVSSGSYADVSVTFPKAFQSVPVWWWASSQSPLRGHLGDAACR